MFLVSTLVWAEMKVWRTHRKTAMRVASWCLAILGLMYLGERSVTDWLVLSTTGIEIDVFWWFMTVLSLSASLLLGGVSWLAVERAVGIKRSWQDGLRAHYYSNIAKYVPGYAWQALSKAYLLRKASFAPKTIAIAIITEYSLIFFTGSIIIIAFLKPWLAASILAGVSAYLIFMRGKTIFKVNWLFTGLVFSAIGWVLLGTAVWALNRAFGVIAFESWSRYVIAFSGSVILGLLAIGVPNGIGVREAVFLLLIDNVSRPNSLAISLIGIRIIFFILEILFVGFVRLLLTEGSFKRYPISDEQ